MTNNLESAAIHFMPRNRARGLFRWPISFQLWPLQLLRCAALGCLLFISLTSLSWAESSLRHAGESSAVTAGVVLNASSRHVPLTRHMRMLEDPTGVMRFADISRAANEGQFRPLKDEAPGFGLTKSAYWFGVLLVNEQARPATWWLEVADTRLQSIDVYWVDANGVVKKKSGGGKRPAADKEVSSLTHVFAIDLAPHEARWVHIRLASDFALVAPFYLWDPLAFSEHSRNAYVGLSLYFGVLAAMLAYNGLIWLTLRDRSYGWYVAFLAMAFVNFATYYGVADEFLFPHSPELVNILFPLSYPLMTGVCLFFARVLLKGVTPRQWQKYLYQAAMALSVVSFILSALGQPGLGLLVMAFAGISSLAYFVTFGFTGMRAGSLVAVYFLAGWSIFLLGGLLFMLSTVFNVLEWTGLTKNTFVIGSAAEMILFAVALSARMRKLKEDHAQAQQIALETVNTYNQKLEREVAERTEALGVAHAQTSQYLEKVQTLLNHAGEGFLSFGPDLIVEEGYSSECLQIFQSKEIRGKVSVWLAPDDEHQRQFLEKTLAEILNPLTNELLVETYISLLPDEYVLHGRYCKARYTYLKEASGIHGLSSTTAVVKTPKLMIVLSDVTDEKNLERILHKERRELEFIVYTLGHRDEFLKIDLDFQSFVRQVLPDLLSPRAVPSSSLNEIFRQIHTFKSLFAQVNCPELPEYLHDVESGLAKLRESSVALDMAQLSGLIDANHLLSLLDRARHLLRTHLGANYFDAKRTYRISESHLHRIEAELMRLVPDLPQSAVALFQSLRYEPLSKLLLPHSNTAVQLAQRQGKVLLRVDYQGHDPLLDSDSYGELLCSLVHVFKNAVDHGIEEPEERVDVGKSEHASLQCRVEIQDDFLCLEVEDDGRGIDTAQLRSKVIEVGALSAEAVSGLSDHDVCQLVFLDGVSSKDEVTESSGRGVGLASLRSAVEKLAGSVSVLSAPGQGVRLLVSVPLREGSWLLS